MWVLLLATQSWSNLCCAFRSGDTVREPSGGGDEESVVNSDGEETETPRPSTSQLSGASSDAKRRRKRRSG